MVNFYYCEAKAIFNLKIAFVVMENEAAYYE